MYRLRDMKNGFFQIHQEKGQAFEGTPISVFAAAVKMGVMQKDLAQAVELLQQKNHDYADFNDYGRLTITKKNN